MMISPHDSRLIAAEVLRLQRQDKWYKRWKLIAITAVISLLVMMLGGKKSVPDQRHLAMVNVSGMISQDSDIWRQLDKVSQKDTQGLLVLFNSGGGTVGASERLYNRLRNISEAIPVEILIEDQATSGAYLAALAGDKIYAYNSSIIGSIGVLMQSFNVEKLTEQLGVKVETMTTGKYKGFPSPFRETPEEVKSHLENVMLEDNKWFVNLVKERRQLQSSKDYDQAQVYTAREGIALKLLDGVSTRAEAFKRLKEKAGDYPLRDLEIDDSNSLLQNLLGRKAQYLPKGLLEWSMLAY
jgi:protease-4